MGKVWSVGDFIARIGTEIGTSDWYRIDQQRINDFARITDDDQFIHTDPVRAHATAFGGTIAHGYLILSLLSAMFRTAIPYMEGTKIGLNYGFDKIRFLNEVPSESSVRARFTLVSLDERSPGQWRMGLGVVIEIEGAERPAIVADWLTLIVT